MPLTAEQSYALGTSAGRDRINQQLRSDPQYTAFLRSIGVDPSAPRLSDQQRQQAQAWVRNYMGGSIGDLVIDPSGNLNNQHGFRAELKQWGLPAAAAAGIAAPFVLPAVFGAGAGSGAGAASGLIPNSGSALTAGLTQAVPATIASQGASAGLGLGAGAAGAAGSAGGGGLGTVATVPTAAAAGGSMADRLKQLFTSPEGIGAAASIAAALATGNSSSDQQKNLEEQAARNAAITEARMRRVDPLHEAAVQLAFSRLPVNSRQGINLTRIPLPE